MKKLLFIIVVLLSFSCCKEIDNSKSKYNRIKLVETTIIKSRRYNIIKVDDKEYFVSTKGGIIELKSE